MLFLSVVVISLLIIIILLCFKLITTKYEVRSLTKQFKNMQRDVKTNQLLRSETNDIDTQKMITEMNKFLNLIRQDRMDYIKKDKLLKQEITNISHDLRTPLTTIKGYTEILDSNLTNEEFDKYLSVVKVKTDTLINTVNLFHEITRINSLDYKLNIEELNITDFFKDQFLHFYQQFEDKNIDVRFEGINVNVCADKDMMGRIISNLIQNLLRYAKSFVSIKVDIFGNQATVVLSNDSDTIEAANDNSKYFERLYSQSLNKDERNGIGLYIVQELLTKQGGHAEIEVVDSIFNISLTLPIPQK